MDLFKKYPVLSLGVFALVTLIIAYYLGARTGKGKSNSEVDSELNNSIIAIPLTYELSEYESFADRLHTSMTTLADDESSINSVFRKMRNRSDVLQLINSFGKRSSWVWNVGGGSLASWMSLKLSNGEIETINGILSDANIDFQF